MPLPAFLTAPRRWRTLFLWAWLIFWAGYLFAETVSWTNPLDGLVFALHSTPLVLVVFGGGMPPLLMLTVAIWKWRNWPPAFRTLCALYPALVFAAMAVVVALTHLAEPSGRFQKAYGGGLPEDTREFHAFFSRTGFWEPQDAFAFQTTPEATKALLAAHPFAETTTDLWTKSPATALILAHATGGGWPDPRSWPGLKAYHYDQAAATHGFELLTDATMTRVFIVVWSD